MLASIIYNYGKFCDDFKSTLKLGAYLLFVGWQNFYEENVFTKALAKVGRDYSMLIYVLHYAVLQAFSRGFEGRKNMLARGYHQYGMMFVFAGTAVIVAIYIYAKKKLRMASTVSEGRE